MTSLGNKMPESVLSRAWSLWGWENFTQGHYEEAKHAFEEAIRLDAYNFRAYYGLGRYFLRCGAMEEAEKAFTRCLELNPRASLGEEGFLLLERRRRRWIQVIRRFIRAMYKVWVYRDEAFV